MQRYQPYLNKKQWIEVISKLNPDQKELLKLFIKYRQLLHIREAKKELNESEKTITNRMGHITRVIGKIINIKATENRWYYYIPRGINNFWWVISSSDYNVLKEIVKEKKL